MRSYKMFIKDKENIVAMFDVSLDPEHAFATPEVDEALEELHRIKRQIKLLEESEALLASKIKEFMGDKEALVGQDGTVMATYKSYEGTEKLHIDTLKCIFPDIYKECLAKSEAYRRFLLK